jgi:hypothetical protein
MEDEISRFKGFKIAPGTDHVLKNKQQQQKNPLQSKKNDSEYRTYLPDSSKAGHQVTPQAQDSLVAVCIRWRGFRRP